MKTNLEKYDPAMRITTQEAADAWLEGLIQLNMGTSESTPEEADEIERANLGYWAGYGTLETRGRVERLFRCRHPLLPAADEPQPSASALFQLGWQFGKSCRKFRRGREESKNISIKTVA
jgi:hypothetical protein